MCGSMAWINAQYDSTCTVMKRILKTVKVKILQVYGFTHYAFAE